MGVPVVLKRILGRVPEVKVVYRGNLGGCYGSWYLSKHRSVPEIQHAKGFQMSLRTVPGVGIKG